jgi:hypothetical protein
MKDKYTYKGNEYIIENISAFKHPDSREWVDCVIYISLTDWKRWVREKTEFYRLFTKVE